jgi:hypothetical protein
MTILTSTCTKWLGGGVGIRCKVDFSLLLMVLWISIFAEVSRRFE